LKEKLQFGKRLEKLMLDAGFNNSQLARKVGVSHVMIGNWLKNDMPKTDHFKSLANIFGLTMDQLYSGDVPKVLLHSEVKLQDEIRPYDVAFNPVEVKCRTHFINFLATCKGDEELLAWTHIELKRHFPLDLWERGRP
jgi:transcriptional regulator with XRE-family HTH domain